MLASGKHTIGTLVAEALGILLFQNHLAIDAALALFPFGTPSFRRIRADIWCLCFDEAAEADQSFVFTFQPEATVHPGLIDRLVEIVESKGGQVVFVELQCSVDATLARLGEPSRRSFKKLTDPELYMAIEKEGGFCFPTMPEAAFRVDTEMLTAEQSAEMIVEALRR